uniref:ATP synthase complex subunit 8 n=1 Tax=Orthocis pygmaeus TaxID=433259 RepID=A0A343C511_9CUCU|nr:ATP synthase F0 subunit 8 [Orthocis pygmaeus]
MPQMSPLNWLSLMIISTIMLYLFLTTNYFNLLYNSNNKKSIKEKMKINWKW